MKYISYFRCLHDGLYVEFGCISGAAGFRAYRWCFVWCSFLADADSGGRSGSGRSVRSDCSIQLRLLDGMIIGFSWFGLVRLPSCALRRRVLYFSLNNGDYQSSEMISGSLDTICESWFVLRVLCDRFLLLSILFRWPGYRISRLVSLFSTFSYLF